MTRIPELVISLREAGLLDADAAKTKEIQKTAHEKDQVDGGMTYNIISSESTISSLQNSPISKTAFVMEEIGETLSKGAGSPKNNPTTSQAQPENTNFSEMPHSNSPIQEKREIERVENWLGSSNDANAIKDKGPASR